MEIPKEINDLITKVSRQGYVKSQEYVNAAFELNVRMFTLEREFRVNAQKLAQKKKEIFAALEGKRTVAAADLEIETTDEYRELRELEDIIEHIKRSIQIAKKASDLL